MLRECKATATQCFRLGGLQQYFPLVSEAEFWGEIDSAEMARDASVLTTSTAEAVSLNVRAGRIGVQL